MSEPVAPKGRAGKAPRREARETETHAAQLEEELQGKVQRIEELRNRMAYLQADLENLHKRMERERSELVQVASEDLVRRLLPVVEEFELALEAVRDREDEGAGGFRMVYENLMKVLREEGVQVLDPQGEPFDPYLHEAMDRVEGEEEGRVAEVRRKGYRLARRVLRPARVVVTKKGGDAHG